MYYKRHEAFRYTFGTPLPGKLKKTSEDIISDVQILDMSQHGVKVELTSEEEWSRGTAIYLEFMLTDENFHAVGEIIWTKPLGSTVQLGLELDTDKEWKQELTNDLKQYAKKHS